MRIAEKFQSALRAVIHDHRLQMPSLPVVAARIAAVATRLDTTAAQLAAEIATDPALTARIMRVANSSLYRSAGQVDTLAQAIARLSVPTTRHLVIGLSLSQVERPKSPPLQERLTAFWARSVEVAAVSRVLASHYASVNAEEAMLAGLVHRIGVLPVLALADDMPEIAGEGRALDDLIEGWHPQLGTQLLQSWQFPDEFVAVPENVVDLARTHDGPPDLSDIVTVASLRSQIAGSRTQRISATEQAVPAYEKLGIGPDLDTVLLAGLEEEVAEAGRLLQTTAEWQRSRGRAV